MEKVEVFAHDNNSLSIKLETALNLKKIMSRFNY